MESTRAGGIYVPPHRTRQALATPEDQSSEAYQRLSWEALRKSLNGLINKVNTSNLREIVLELFGENLIRGRGLLIKSLMRAQTAALPFTPIYAALVAVINTKLPMVGELLVNRLIHQFRRAYRRNDKTLCLAGASFLAHLVNQRVAHEIICLQLLTLLLERPTDDSVEIAVGFTREVGAFLIAHSPRPAHAIFERMRAILVEGAIDKRVQYMIEVLFQVRKEGFKEHPAVRPELDLIPAEDQITHYASLDDEIDPQETLNVFKLDPQYLENEAAYEEIKAEILGGLELPPPPPLEEEEGEEEAIPAQPATVDLTGAELVNLRKKIYLIIMSGVDFEEIGHKLLKSGVPPGQEQELVSMIVECCSQERTYNRMFGLLSERFCQLSPDWQGRFEFAFGNLYSTVHRLETNRIRNVASLFAHLLCNDAISWAILEQIKLGLETTTASSRILIKFLLQAIQENWGVPRFLRRLEEPGIRPWIAGLFPRANDPNATRFAIRFLQSISLAPLAKPLLDHLEATGHELESTDEEEEEEEQDRLQIQEPIRMAIRSPERRNERSQSPPRYSRRDEQPRSPLRYSRRDEPSPPRRHSPRRSYQ